MNLTIQNVVQVDLVAQAQNKKGLFMAKLTQRDRILKYLQDFGSITSYEAYTELGITQLGARIFELKRQNYEFKDEYIYRNNRYGESVKFKKYSLV